MLGGEVTWRVGSGPSLLEYLDEMKPPERLYDKALRLPIVAKYRERGTIGALPPPSRHPSSALTAACAVQ